MVFVKIFRLGPSNLLGGKLRYQHGVSLMVLSSRLGYLLCLCLHLSFSCSSPRIT